MIKPVSLRTAALALAAALSLTGGISRAQTPDDQLIIAISMNNLLSLDPMALNGREAIEIGTNLYDTLIQSSATDYGTFRPGLAESWEIAEDRRSITFRLRADAVFQSGNPVTAEDFIWSIERAFTHNRGGTTWRTYGFDKDNIRAQIQAPDAQTIVLNLPRPTDPALILMTLASNAISHVIDSRLALENQVDGDLGAAWLATNSAGSGPFRLRNWQPNSLVLLERFDGYWDGPAKMNRLIYRHMPESQSQRLALERADIDIGMAMAVADLQALENRDGVVVDSALGGNVYYLAVNMKDQRFADRDVRLALRHLIDYQGINETIMPFYGVLHQRPIQKGLMGSLEDPGYAPDVDKAKALLAKAGYPDGFRVRLHALAETPFINIATAIQATLAEAGISAEIVPGNGDVVYSAMRNRDFEMIVGRGGGGGNPYTSLLSLAYNPDNSDEARLVSQNSWRTSFQSPGINLMLEAALIEPDSARQSRLYEEIQLLYEALVPAIQPISQVVDSVALRSDITGYDYHPNWTTRYHGVGKSR